MNKVILVGNLGADPTMRYASSGEAIANFQLATTDRYRDKASGEMKEATEWHKCAAFGRQAEIVGEYLRKGSSVYIEGKLRTRKYQATDGADRYSTEIRVDIFQMLGGRQAASGGEGGGDERRESTASHEHRGGRQAAQTSGAGADYDDDLPF